MNLKNALHHIVRPIHQRRWRRQFHNPTLSVFSSNCVGACMLHDLGARFNSPFVNLYMSAADYLTFLQDPHRYTSLPLEEIPSDGGYPMARWGDLTLHLVHYPSVAAAQAAFDRRIPRINYDNLYVLFVERDGCTYEDLLTFDRLPYAHKVVFTHCPYPAIASAYCVGDFGATDEVGNILKWDTALGHKRYDAFDFATWLNEQ